MAWRLSARKDRSVINSGAKNKKAIKDEARRLRKQGYSVTVYEVK